MFVPLLNIHSWRSTGTLLKRTRIYRLDIKVVFGFPSILNWIEQILSSKVCLLGIGGRRQRPRQLHRSFESSHSVHWQNICWTGLATKRGFCVDGWGKFFDLPAAAGEISPDIWPDLVDRMSGQIKRVCQYDLDNNELLGSQNKGSLASTPLLGFSHTQFKPWKSI